MLGLILLFCLRTVSVVAEGQQLPDYYQVLEITPQAKAVDIKKAYRKMSQVHHPDKNLKRKAEAEQNMKLIAEAYKVLMDFDRRMVFDYKSGRRKRIGSFYSKSEHVKRLSPHDFQTYVYNKRKDSWIVKFYAPWCGHCQEMVGQYKAAAVEMEGVVKFGAVDCTSNRVCNQVGIQSYPTLLYFSKDLTFAEDTYTGQHTSQSLIEFLQRKVKQEKFADLVQLTPDNFDALVLEDPTMWLVDFSAGSWCGPCTKLAPMLKSLSGDLHGAVKIGIINCDLHKDFCRSKQATEYPHLRGFSAGRNKSPVGEQMCSFSERSPFDVVVNLLEKSLRLSARATVHEDSQNQQQEVPEQQCPVCPECPERERCPNLECKNCEEEFDTFFNHPCPIVGASKCASDK
mmetsp:Transcript_9560/g.18135  ORF Transcript_9560/g.18135 Transcript_9560/m.18135 type:complete len:399 (+) Transcript_9560:19-1215(+)